MGDFSVGFGSSPPERDLALPVEGEIPAWLSGTLVRNGPGKFRAGGEAANHWFDGLAMCQRFAFEDGEVRYRNRYLRTDTYASVAGEGFSTGQFGTGGGYLARLRALATGATTDNANVAVHRLGGEFVAVTETPERVLVDPEGLGVEGHLSYADDVDVDHVTAHFRRDDRAGVHVGHGTRFGRTCAYVVYEIPMARDDGTPDAAPANPGVVSRHPIAEVEVEQPAYLHSVGVTPDHVVIVEPPYTMDPMDLVTPGGDGFVDHFEWDPDRETRLFVVERDTGDLAATLRTDPFFVFHHVNAYEDGDAIVLDLVAYDDARVVADLSLDVVGETDPDVPDGQLRRYRVDPAAGAIDERGIYEGIELPRVAPAARLRPYRYAFGQATARDGQNGIVKIDVATGTAEEWWAPDVFAEEPVFVPRPRRGADGAKGRPGEGTDDHAEDDGVLLATAVDAEAERSLLLVLDARTMAELARAPLPHVAPFGFHGRYFPSL